MVIFHNYVSSPEGFSFSDLISYSFLVFDVAKAGEDEILVRDHENPGMKPTYNWDWYIHTWFSH